MAVGLPVVVTDTCGFAGLIAEADAGLVVDDSVEALSAALGALLADPDGARARGARGRRAVEDRWGIGTVARELEARYAATR